MPNWCSNTLTIYSEDTKQIAKFKKIASKNNKGNDKTDLSLANFVPLPKDKTNDWYNWQIDNWGTKWELNEVELIDESEDYLLYRFDTAWSPPVKWLEKVAKDYPELDFRLKYEEEGVGFLGVAKSRAGATEVQEISL